MWVGSGLVLVPPDDVCSKVLLQTPQGMAHALQLTANLSESFAKPRLSIAQPDQPFPDLLVGVPALLAHTIELLPHTIELLPHTIELPPHTLELSPYVIETLPHGIETSPHGIELAAQDTPTERRH